MINFFRKTRKKLADDNKFFKYSRYAIGEIVLVMIGILLALQVNNWNEERQNQKETHKVLLQLKQEFETNNEIIDASIKFHSVRLNAIKGLKGRFNPKNKITSDSVKALVSDLGSDWKYEPVKNIIESVISSGKINLIKNDSVKNAIRYWGTAISKYDELYRSQDELHSRNILPIIYEHYPLMEFDTIHNSNFKPNTDAIFNNLKNENLFFLFKHEVALLLHWTKGVRVMQDDALSKIDLELNKMTDE